MEKKFSKIQIATIKKVAQLVSKDVVTKEKLQKKIAELQEEIAGTQVRIDGFQTPIKQITGGYTTEDLVEREVVHTGKLNDKGKEILQTKYNLKYPETIIPVAESSEPATDNSPVADENQVPASEPVAADSNTDANTVGVTEAATENEPATVLENSNPWD